MSAAGREGWELPLMRITALGLSFICLLSGLVHPYLPSILSPCEPMLTRTIMSFLPVLPWHLPFKTPTTDYDQNLPFLSLRSACFWRKLHNHPDWFLQSCGPQATCANPLASPFLDFIPQEHPHSTYAVLQLVALMWQCCRRHGSWNLDTAWAHAAFPHLPFPPWPLIFASAFLYYVTHSFHISFPIFTTAHRKVDIFTLILPKSKPKSREEIIKVIINKGEIQTEVQLTFNKTILFLRLFWGNPH